MEAPKNPSAANKDSNLSRFFNWFWFFDVIWREREKYGIIFYLKYLAVKQVQGNFIIDHLSFLYAIKNTLVKTYKDRPHHLRANAFNKFLSLFWIPRIKIVGGMETISLHFFLLPFWTTKWKTQDQCKSETGIFSSNTKSLPYPKLERQLILPATALFLLLRKPCNHC